MRSSAALPLSVAIVTTARNAARWAESCARSVARQSATRGWRWIYWDDGSTDGTLDAAGEAWARHAGVVPIEAALFVSGGHMGRLAALKAATDIVTEDAMLILDADDMLLGRCVEELACMLARNPEASAVHADYFEIDESDRRTRFGARCLAAVPLLHGLKAFHPRLIRMSAFREAGGWGECHGAEDYDLMLRLEEVGPILHLREPLYNYRRHPEQFSERYRLQQKAAAERAVQAAIQRRNHNPEE